jgi:uncharacterized protein YbjT (DUF2867 family)
VRVLIAGVTGLIGSSIAAALQRDGHSVIGTTRRKIDQPQYDCVTLDMRTAREADWQPLLRGIDAVVNCVGVLQDNFADSTHAAHADGPGALFAACEAASVRKVIHFSAIGIDRETPTEFSRSKALGDSALMASNLNWVILRPSVVVGQSAYGGSALFRGLAALPLLPRLPLAGQLQIVQLTDVVSTVLFFLRKDAPTRVVIEMAGPERLSLEAVVDEYRTWMGQRPAQRLRLPQWVMRAVYFLGDFAGWLGWRPPIRSTAAAEMRRGAIGDPTQWTELTGIKPTALRDALNSSPVSVQERWFSRLYLLKPVIFTIFSLFWIATAFMSLGPGWDIGIGLMHEGGVTGIAAPLTVIAGALADLAIGLGIAWRKTTRPALYAAFFLSLAYVVIGTCLVPRLWIDPLGPMLKIWPVLALNMTAIAIIEDR